MKNISAPTLTSTMKPLAYASSRMQFIDNIRWAMIVLVIFHHSAVTYSHVGSWFYNEGPDPGLGPKLLMATFLSFNQAYFMGFLFLIAGYFSAPSFDRKGFSNFVRDKLVRLGIPSLLFMLVIYPLIVYWMLRDFYDPKRPSIWAVYPSFIASGKVLSASGPMWFAVALLIFCVLYALLRSSPANSWRMAQADAYPLLPHHLHVIVLIAVLAITTFLVRIFQPIGTSVLNMQLCNFAQYVILFALGVVAYRRDWLRRTPFTFALVWFRLALTVLLWVAVLASSGVFKGRQPSIILGGLHWQSLLYCVWESLVCVGMSLGVLVIFRDRVHLKAGLAAFMSRNAFSAYLFHTPLLIAVTLALHDFSAPPLIQFPVAGAIAVVVTFLLSEYLFRRLPLLERIL